MWRGTLRNWIACLIGVLLCFSALLVQFDDCHSAVRNVGQRGQVKGAVISILSVHRRWRRSTRASASRLLTSKLSPPSQIPPTPAEPPHSKSSSAKSSPEAPAPSLVATLSAPQPAIAGNSSEVNGTHSSVNRSSPPAHSLPLPALPNTSSPSISPQSQPVSHASAPSPSDISLSTQPPLPQKNTSSIQPPLAPSPPTTSSLATSPAPSLSSPPLEALPNGNVTPSDSPLTSPSSGCCAPNMVPRPGLPSDSCTCVYPIRLELLVADVSTNYANWSSEFQQELASQLGLEVIQIEITSFQFTGPNLSLVIVIGPVTSNSFSLQESETIKTDLDHYKVHFNTSLFGNYSLLRFRYFESPTPAPVQTQAPGLPPLPLVKMLPPDGSTDQTKRHALSAWVIIAIAAGAAIVVSVLLVLLWRYFQPCRARKISYRCSMKGVSSRATSSAFDASSYDTRSLPRSITTRLFTFDELKQATNNFEPASVLGEGGFGRVYKGVLKDGTAVAIKRLTGGSQGDREFLVEVEMLSRLHHRNLVKLVGYYTSRDSSQHLLCYELIPNGSLEAWLHGPLGANQPLQWDIRMKIALDAARGLAYLHEDSQPSVIHRDFKASNILIENDFHAKVADFGLAKQAPEGQINYVATRVMGTFGYVAPEYAMTGHLLVKSDVYSYGVVLLELLSGRKPVDMSQPSGQENLVTWARPILRDKDRLGELADLRLSCKYPREDFAQVAAIAAACVSPEASQRPTMGEVVQSLKMVQQSSEFATSGERNASTDAVMVTSMSNRSFTTSFQNARPTSATFESDGSSSVFSSGPFSGLIGLDNDALSRTAVFSEDLHEGR